MVVGGSRMNDARQHSGQYFELFCIELSSFGHIDFELDNEMSMPVLVSEERHAEVLNYFAIAVSHDFPLLRINGVLPSIEMCEGEVEAQQCLNESDMFFHVEICAFASEHFVRLFFGDENDVSRSCVRLR